MADRVDFGIIKDENGQMFLPATQRPDGSWRKPRKVKDGYIPQEEMPVYESKGTQWKQGVPKCPGLVEDAPSPQSNTPLSKSAKKNAKRKEKKKQQDDQPVNALSTSLQNSSINDSDAKASNSEPGPLSPDDINKKIKNLKKKIKQIDDLKRKIDSGELANPDPDQLAKIERRGEYEAQIEELELDL